MKKALIFTTLVILSLPAFAVDKAAALDLANRNGCLACHSIDKKIVGPAWQDVGKKYGGDPAAEDQLVAKIKKGTKGTWGPIPMPPNATVREADARTLVQYILTLK